VSVELDELVEHWTLLDGDRELVAGKRGATRLGFALLLKFYIRHGRFPNGPEELPEEAVGFVARQVDVSEDELPGQLPETTLRAALASPAARRPSTAENHETRVSGRRHVAGLKRR
jgi:hypothetical protein